MQLHRGSCPQRSSHCPSSPTCRRACAILSWCAPQVVNVAFAEWDKLQSDGARKAMLQTRINEALVQSVGSAMDVPDSA